MGLLLQKETKYGVTGEYWKINKDTFKTIRGFDLELYKDKATRDADKHPLEVKNYNFPIEDSEGNIVEESPCTVETMKLKDPYAVCYEWLKENTEFTNAIDILET